MCYASEHMKMKVRLGGIMQMASGDGLFKDSWKNSGPALGFISLTPNSPGQVIPVNLDRLGGSIKCKDGSYMAAIDPQVNISIALLKAASCLACCCSGMDPIMQQISGKGWVFLSSHGTIMQKELKKDEELVVDTNW